MNEKVFKIGIAAIAIIFTILFIVIVIPPLIKNPDVIGAFAAGFVNPYSTGYSVDVICCYATLMFWVIFEMPKIKYGWVCLVLGIVPGVAVGFALYLIMRIHQMRPKDK